MPAIFYGIGVGPGDPGLLPLISVEIINACDIIFCPQASSATESIAKGCLARISVPEEKIEIISFGMEEDRTKTMHTYSKLAEKIAHYLKAGKSVAYLTIGDSLTYSTYSYAISALKHVMPEAQIITIPGITSYAATAAKFNYPLGQGKERVLILPCPQTAQELQQDIESHDLIVLMKIGHRFSMVISLLKDMDIIQYCTLASHVGLVDEELYCDLSKIDQQSNLNPDNKIGYLSTILIRKSPIPVLASNSKSNKGSSL